MLRWFMLMFFSVSVVFSHASYRGYSGAPGSSGKCASSCHGSGTGSIVLTGVPTSYQPLKTYTIGVKHTSGSAIYDFNLSTRKGTTTTFAGTLTAGTNAASYSAAETGMRLSSSGKDSAVIQWTAPEAGTGSVNFYLAGLQGSKSGQNTSLTLSSSELLTAIGYDPIQKYRFNLEQNYPNPFNPLTVINYQLPSTSSVCIKIYDMLGKDIATVVDEEQQAGNYQIQFSTQQYHLSSGVYWYELRAGTFQSIKKMILTK
jgi:hypothetical protein